MSNYNNVHYLPYKGDDEEVVGDPMRNQRPPSTHTDIQRQGSSVSIQTVTDRLRKGLVSYSYYTVDLNLK